LVCIWRAINILMEILQFKKYKCKKAFDVFLSTTKQFMTMMYGTIIADNVRLIAHILPSLSHILWVTKTSED
jgi:hypothetical protein